MIMKNTTMKVIASLLLLVGSLSLNQGVASAASPTKIGMSAPASEYEARLKEVGPGIKARRIFGTDLAGASAINLAKKEIARGVYPVISLKVPGNDWAGVASGKYDAQLRSTAAAVAALNAPLFITVHHEPIGDGTAANWSKMLVHALPILKNGKANVQVGPIINGFVWSAASQGMTDAEIAQWIPPSLIAVSDVIAGDTYHGGTTAAPKEDASVKIKRMGAWATRKGVKKLGIGEYNGITAQAITNAGDALLADPRFAFACIFNSNNNNRDGVSWQLTGSRLTAFRATLAKAAA